MNCFVDKLAKFWMTFDAAGGLSVGGGSGRDYSDRLISWKPDEDEGESGRPLDWVRVIGLASELDDHVFSLYRDTGR
jgi:hypothetical protein